MLIFFYFSHSPYLQFSKSVPSKYMFTKNDKVNCTILKQISTMEIIFKECTKGMMPYSIHFHLNDDLLLPKNQYFSI